VLKHCCRVIAKFKTIAAASGAKGQIKAKHRTMRIVGCSFLLAQQLAVLIAAVVFIFKLHLAGILFIIELVVAIEAFCFLGLIVGLVAMMLWYEIKHRPLFP
jgi:uncharacterized membrane protein